MAELIGRSDVRGAGRASLMCIAVLLALGYAAVPNKCPAQATPPPQPGNPMTAWANWVNNQLPQAVPQQTITLGNFQASQSSTSKMAWQPSVPAYSCPPGGGGVVSLNPPLCLTLNSYDMRYQIAIARPPNYDVQVVLTAPLANGDTEKIAGTIQESSTSTTTRIPQGTGSAVPGARPIAPPNGSRPLSSGSVSNNNGGSQPASAVATISFHPHVLGTQYIQFFHAGSLMNCNFDGQSLPCSFSIKAALQPQLGAFVVPLLPVTVIYQPQGCGPCASTSDTCGSFADYVIGSTVGTTLSWDYSSTSGTVNSKSSSELTDDYSAFLSALSMIPGPNSAALSTASSVLGAVKSIWNTETITTQQNGNGNTQSIGWSISFQKEFTTDICRNEDLFVFLKNVLFVYTVVTKDPVSGNIAPYGVPTVVISAVHYDEPVVALWTSQVQSQLPQAAAQQLLALDLQADPSQLNLAIRSAQPPRTSDQKCQSQSAKPPRTGGPSQAGVPLMNGPLTGRLSYISCEACPTTYRQSVKESLLNFSQSASYHTETTTTTTNVSGFLASLLGKSGVTTQTVTYTSNRAYWQQNETASGLSLQCPEYAPADALTMQIFLDTRFGSLLAVPEGIYQPTGFAAAASPNPQGVQGTLQDAQGRPVANQPVTLNIAGHQYGTRTDKNGNFAFRSRVAILPAGSGSLIVSNQQLPVTYKHTLTTLNVKLSGSTAAGAKVGRGITVAGVGSTAGSPPAARAPTSGNASSPRSGGPLSSITAIDTRTGTVTAKVNGTGQAFQFTLSNRAFISQLRVGEGVYANLTTRQVSLDGRTAAGTITSLSRPDPGYAAKP
jgi:hypothetical protein